MKSKIKNGAFCVLPWIQNYSTLDGKNYFCCHSNVSIEPGTESALREKIWNGVKIEACEKCYRLEENKVVSPRLSESIKWLKDSEVNQYFQSTPVEPKIYFYDLRYDNKCNLACISCSPKFSTLWAKELDSKVDTVTPEVIAIDQIRSLKKIYFAGGEPLIIDKFIEILSIIADEELNIEVQINTNLTAVTDPVIDILKRLKDCCLIVSVDAYGTVNEYHRYPMSWEKFMRNLDTVKSNNIKIMFNTTADAVSVFGFKALRSLEDYASNWHLTILTRPESLLVENIPDALKQVAVDSVCDLKSCKFYLQDPNFKSKVDQLIKQIARNGNESLLSNYIKALDQRRNINHQDYLNINKGLT